MNNFASSVILAIIAVAIIVLILILWAISGGDKEEETSRDGVNFSLADKVGSHVSTLFNASNRSYSLEKCGEITRVIVTLPRGVAEIDATKLTKEVEDLAKRKVKLSQEENSLIIELK